MKLIERIELELRQSYVDCGNTRAEQKAKNVAERIMKIIEPNPTVEQPIMSEVISPT